MREWILSHFGPHEPQAQRRYRDFVEGVLGEEPPSPFEQVVASTLLGSETFVAWVQGEFLEKKPADRELPALREILDKPPPKGIREAVEGWFGEDRATERRVGL